MWKWFNNITIKKRLIASFMVVAMVLIITLSFTLVFLNNTMEISDELVAQVVDPLEYVADARERIIEIIEIERIVLRETNTQAQKALIATIPEKIDIIKLRMNEFYDAIVMDETKTIYYEYENNLHEYEIVINYIILSPYISRDEINDFLYDISELLESSRRSLIEMNNLRFDVARDLIRENKQNAQSTFTLLVIMSIFGVLLTIFFGIAFAFIISNPILHCVKLMTIAAEGDLTIRLPDKYGAELGQLISACNSLLEYDDVATGKISKAIVTLRNSAQEMLSVSTDMSVNSTDLRDQTAFVSTTSEELSAGMTQSSNTIATASSHISSIATSIEEINTTLVTVATAAEQTSTGVEEASSLVNNIQDSISKANESIQIVTKVFNSVADSVDEIDDSITAVRSHSEIAKKKATEADGKAKNTNEVIRRLEDSSRQIGKIVNVISDIADQTNMLALNAAIEAAGAGEAGKGFMVVANEVKELAKQTSEATNDIADQIDDIQRNVPEAALAVVEIVSIINTMTEYINTFAQEMNEQSKRSDEITEESASAAKQMNDISLEMNTISKNAQSVAITSVEAAKSVNAIAKSTSELVSGTREIAMNSERASNNMSEITKAANDMAFGLVGISKNIVLIDEEAGAVRNGADASRLLSEELLGTANELDEMISKFKSN
jgi:methyl-accepting chemotaxis protein